MIQTPNAYTIGEAYRMALDRSGIKLSNNYTDYEMTAAARVAVFVSIRTGLVSLRTTPPKEIETRAARISEKILGQFERAEIARRRPGRHHPIMVASDQLVRGLTEFPNSREAARFGRNILQMADSRFLDV